MTSQREPRRPNAGRSGVPRESDNVEPDRRSRRGRVWGKWLLRTAVSAALLGVVILRTDASRFSSLVARTHWGWWACGLALVLLAPVASAQRGRLLIRGLGHRVSLGSVAAINLEAMFFSLVIPGELVAGLARWNRISRHTGDRTGAFTLLAAERLIDWVMLALVVAAGAPLLFAGESAPRLRWSTAAVAVAVAALGVGVMLAGRSRPAVRVVAAWRGRCGPRTRLWVERLAQLMGAGRALTADAHRNAAVLLWSVAYWLIAVAGSVVMAWAVFPQMPVLPYAAAVAVLALLAQIPLTVAGVGLRELSLPVLLGAYGVTRELGLLVGLSALVPYAILGAAGSVLLLIGRARLEEAPRP